MNIKKYKKFFEYRLSSDWTSTATYPEFSVKYDDINSDLDEIQIGININDLQSEYNENLNVENIKEKAHEFFGDNLYRLLELDSFFKGLLLKLKFDSKESSIKYFQGYINDLPRIYNKINLDFSKSDIKDKFKKVKKLKRKNKKQRKLSKNIFKNEMEVLIIELLKMTEHIKENGMRVLVTCDGRDSAGKGSFIRLIEKYTNEKIVDHKWFEIPNKYDQLHWFDRYERSLPTKGHLKFYDRSWYNRAVNDPVNGYCTEKQYKKYMKDVIPFEERIIDDGLILIKFWFSIGKGTQELRFNLRKASPIKYWKFSPSDAKAVDRFDRFTFYKEQMFAKTSTDKSPWIVVDMDDKKLGQLNAIRYLLTTVPYPNKNEEIIKPYKTKVYKI